MLKLVCLSNERLGCRNMNEQFLSFSSAADFHDINRPLPRGVTYLGGQVVSQEKSSWSGITATVTEVRCDDGITITLSSNCERLSVMLEVVGGQIEFRACETRAGSASHLASSMNLLTDGLSIYGRGDSVRFFRHLVLDFDANMLSQTSRGSFQKLLKPRLMFSEPRLMRLCQLLAEECVDKMPSDLFGHSLAITLLIGLAKLDEKGGQKSAARGGLAPWQMRRVTEYLRTHLRDDTALETLSDMVSLSRSYFCRAFKASTGLPPHQWLLKTRIERAKELLVEGTISLAQIALLIGFADQAHFTRMFTRTVGQSPGAWQKSLCVGTSTRFTYNN